MAESKVITQPQSHSSAKEHKRNLWTQLRRPPVGRGLDLEHGLAGSQGEAIAPQGHPYLDPSMQDVNLQVIRRFSWLNYLALLHHQDEIARLEQSLATLDERAGNHERDFFAANWARVWLLKTIVEKLSTYDSMILQLQSQRPIRKPRADQFRSVRQYLWHEPHNQMSYIEETSPEWIRYGKIVKEVLEDPDTASWLDGPLDAAWTTNYNARKIKETEASLEGLISRIPMILPSLALAVETFIWTSHITAALGSVMIANSSGSSGYPTMNSLLAIWYFTAVGIVVHELLSKGFVYARKVVLGGILACCGGSYALYSVWNVSAASTLSATPTFFTIVLLLIRII